MQLHGIDIHDTYAEVFRMWAARLIVTAVDEKWALQAAKSACGYATSIIGCDAEAGIENLLHPSMTPDARPGVSLLFFARNPEQLAASVLNRAGQCLMTCPTTAVFDGLNELKIVSLDCEKIRLDLGSEIRFFGDGHQHEAIMNSRRGWKIPVMDGEFFIEESCQAIKAFAGGNFLLCGRDQLSTLHAAQHAVNAIAEISGCITPFPGGIVRSGSKVGSRYEGQIASTNDAFCSTLANLPGTKLPTGTRCVYEIVIDALNIEILKTAMRAGILAACETGNTSGLIAISAGNYGGKLGKTNLHLHELLNAAL